MKRSRNAPRLTKPLTDPTRIVIAPVVIASAIALGGCDFGGKEYASIAECEARNGSGACLQEPRPSLMTEDNRPVYLKADDCMNDFGEEHCKPEERKSGRVYRPIYNPGQTYFYPHNSGYTGYYKGSITTAPPTYSPFVRKFGFGGMGRAFGAAASS